MALYKISVHRNFEKELKRIPQQDVLRILDVIASLAKNPYPAGSKKLSGSEAYRTRTRLYRIVYRIEDEELVVYVLKVGHRKDVYR